MAHLLPPAGIDVVQKGDLFRFYQTMPGSEPNCDYLEDIPLNIHDYKWTDYQAEGKLFRECHKAQQEEQARQQQEALAGQRLHPAGPGLHAHPPPQGYDPSRGSPQGYYCPSHHGGCLWGCYSGAHHHFGARCGRCPPSNVDPRSLIRPRNPQEPPSQRPTGKPYFAQESKKSCNVPAEAPLTRKGGFSFKDWLRTEDERRPPVGLRDGLCLPSVCTVCQPQYIHCCPGYDDPRAYTLVQQELPPHFGPRTTCQQPVCCQGKPVL